VAFPAAAVSNDPMVADRQRMRVALIIMFTLYAAMQLYVVAKASAALALTWPFTTAFIAWAALMTAMPLLVWRWEQRDWHRPVLIGAWVGYTWMGVAFLFFWIALALDLTGTVFKLGGTNLELSVRDEFLLACALTTALTIYGFVSARRLRVEQVVLASPKLPAGSDPLRIALISDVHLGALVGARRLRAIIAKLQELDPDLLVSAGDLVDGQADRLNGMAPMIADFRPRYGKFAVSGNHEYFVGLERALAFHARAGFTMLRGNAVDIADSFVIAGVDDPTGHSMGLPVCTDERALLEECSSGRFAILVKHQPRLDQPASGGFDLQLSGHVHKGQIFPFGLLVRLSYPAATGLSRSGDGWLYVSRGTGTWGPPLRVLAPPEITLIELRPTE
jgi:predicted MPP superfamily phosphohydrolase